MTKIMEIIYCGIYKSKLIMKISETLKVFIHKKG